ncbi:Doublecortin domain-containing protein 5 [Microtus ochrogaster]|uniref:Doublecortin domain-containing protein 5 n=1 Tax=Microtus ochrogaster TaxID=79684 RepID=A0A8J6GT01_MICOH|nr:Doublecortin domain-containing protein 5 [Microtus ochrogaster]
MGCYRSLGFTAMGYCSSVGFAAMGYCSSVGFAAMGYCSSVGFTAMGYCSSVGFAAMGYCSNVGFTVMGYCRSLGFVAMSYCRSLGFAAMGYCRSAGLTTMGYCSSVGPTDTGYCVRLLRGLLVPIIPAMKRPVCRTPEQCVPVRLQILKNGDKGKSRALVMGPDVLPGRTPRCTEILDLPFAARRLFDEKGKEIFSLNDLQRDELVYVSCGEAWINPDLSIAQQRKQVLLRSLEFDVSKIKTFCSLCKEEALVLEVQSDLVSGGKLVVHKPVVIVEEEKQEKGLEGTQMQNDALIPGDAPRDALDSHARAHLRMEACRRMPKYAWQDPSFNLADGYSLPKKTDKELLENVQPQKKHSHFQKHSKLQKLQHQEFEYRNRRIISFAAPQLVLGIQGCKPRSGTKVVLVEKKSDDGNQRWAHKEESSTALDRKITAANSSGLCTSSVTKENIDQPSNQGSLTCGKPKNPPPLTRSSKGYCYLSPDGKKKMMLCLACGQSMRAEKGLKQLIPRTPFFCVSGSEQKSLPRKPFKVISVAKADLSSYEAENTLRYYEERLSSLWMKARTCTTFHSGVVPSYKKAVKIIAYKNGDGYQNGKLIMAGTFHGLLAEYTERLGLTRAASKIYTRDGTNILTLRGLVLWAIGETLTQRYPETQERSTESLGTEQTAVQNTEAPQNSEKLKKQNWLKKDQILADLDTMRHKMRQLKGRRVAARQPATMVPTQSPLQPVVMEGGWTEQTQEEMKLMERIRETEVQLSKGKELQPRCSLTASQCKVTQQHSLYLIPSVKRVWAYQNGGRPDDGAYVWASTISEFLDECTARLKMSHPAKTLYTSNGELIQSWDSIEKDMIVCVSAGRGFMTSKEKQQLVEIKANYARIQRQRGREATDIVVSPSMKLLSLLQPHN